MHIPDFESRQGKEIFLFSEAFRPAVGPSALLCIGYLEILSRDKKAGVGS
jgi:hypothetical protein